MYEFGFERLIVWQEGRRLVKKVYLYTLKFPAEEKYCMCNQIRRAAISVCSNIAEGSSRRTSKEQFHFTTLAYGSLTELLNQFIICLDLGYITEENLIQIRKHVQSLSVKLNNLRIYQQNMGA